MSLKSIIYFLFTVYAVSRFLQHGRYVRIRRPRRSSYRLHTVQVGRRQRSCSSSRLRYPLSIASPHRLLHFISTHHFCYSFHSFSRSLSLSLPRHSCTQSPPKKKKNRTLAGWLRSFMYILPPVQLCHNETARLKPIWVV